MQLLGVDMVVGAVVVVATVVVVVVAVMEEEEVVVVVGAAAPVGAGAGVHAAVAPAAAPAVAAPTRPSGTIFLPPCYFQNLMIVMHCFIMTLLVVEFVLR